MATYPIIPSSEFFQPESTSLATPDRFNAIFNAINTRGVSEQGFIRPVQIAADYTGIAVDSNGDCTIDLITFYEVGGALAPLDASGATSLYDITYAWSSVGSHGGASGASDASSFSLDLTGTSDPDTDDVQVSLTITYTDTSANIIYEQTIEAGVPLVEQGIQGDPAISTAIPLMYAAFNHVPVDLVTGYAEVIVQNVSMVPTAWGGGYNISWTLKDENGSIFSNYITSSSIDEATLQIPVYNKRYILEMQIDNGGGLFATTVDIFTYKNGVLFLHWDTGRVPSNPSYVALLGQPSLHPNTSFPVPNGSIKVTWGWDTSNFGTVGFESYDSNTSVVSAALVEAYGAIPAGELKEYGVLSIDPTNISLSIVGQYLFIPNMTTPVLIDRDVSSISDSLISLSSNISESGTYLVKGLPITGQLSGRFNNKVSIGPGAERYYIHLAHYSESIVNNTPDTYMGLYDQYSTIVPEQLDHPVSAVFNNVPSSAKFHATVVTAIGSVYSPGAVSTDLGSVSLSTATTVTGVEIEGQQFGVIIDITLGANEGSEDPIGFLIAYKEYNITATVDVNSYSFASKNSSGFNVIYSNSSHVHLPATLGKKVVAWVKAVMADGSTSVAMNSNEQVVEFPASLDQTSLTKHLGRFNDDLGVTGEWEQTWESDNPNGLMYTTHYTSFAKTTLIQGITVWIHNLATSATDDYDLVINLGGDEHTLIATLDSADFNYVDPIPFKYKDLGKIVQAGSPISINIRNSNDDNSLGNLSGAAVDITSEITYAYNYDEDNAAFASSTST